MGEGLGRSYTERDVELSRRLYKHLIHEAKVLSNGFVTYKEVAEPCGVFHRTIRGALYYIQDRCNERGWPTLTVWVVRKDTNRPGLGCDVVRGPDVLEMAERTKNTPWPGEP